MIRDDVGVFIIVFLGLTGVWFAERLGWIH
jgi:hypothetical protein